MAGLDDLRAERKSLEFNNRSGLRPRTGHAPHDETHPEQDDQEPHTDVAKGEPRLGVTVVGPTSGRFSNLSERAVAEEDCRQRGWEKKDGQNSADQAGRRFPVGPVRGGKRRWRIAARGLQWCSATVAGPRSLLILRSTI